MRENMNISVNGQSRVPPGFRFHPTEEELLQYYLRKKVASLNIDLDVIFEVDLNKLEPWDIQERCKIGTTPQNDWYFFSHKDKKYPTGTRTNRATVSGFWKATGRDKVIHSNGKRIGMRKTLVFYKGRAPHGLKSDWIMHEYRLDDTTYINNDTHVLSGINGESIQEEGWVVCRIFKKKNHPKTQLDVDNTSSSSTFTFDTTMIDSSTDHHHDQGVLEQIFQSMGPTSQINTRLFQVDNFIKLPTLETQDDTVLMARAEAHPETGLTDWAALDWFVATHLNGQPAMSTIYSSQPSSTTDHSIHDEIIQLPPLRSSENNKVYQSDATLDNNNNYQEIDLWNFTRSATSSSSFPVDPLCHVSDVGL